MTPETNETNETQNESKSKVIEISRTRFDLDSKKDVEVIKRGNFSRVSDMAEFVSRLGNDSEKILEIVNEGLEEFERKQLANSDTPWFERDDETGTLTPFSGTLLSDEKSKQLGATVLNFARMLFGYDKKMDADPAKNRTLKAEAKQKALDAILSNPAALEALKK